MSDRSDDTGQTPEVSGSGGPAHAREAPSDGGPAPSPETSGGGPEKTGDAPDAASTQAAGESGPTTERDDRTDPTPQTAELDAPVVDSPVGTDPEATGPLPIPETETSGDSADTAALPVTDDTPTAIAPAVETDDDTRMDPGEAGPGAAVPPVLPAPASTEPPSSTASTTSTASTSPAYSPFSTASTEPIVPAHSTGAATAADRTAILDRPGGGAFLTARGLTANGRQGPIFTDVNLTAHLGQLVAVCGDGGDGRSSLLLALTGRFDHQHGTLEVDGQTKPGQIRRRFTIAQAGPPIRFEPYATVGACIKETITVSGGAATRANIGAWLDRLAVGVDSGDTYGFLPRIDQIRFAIACAAAGRTPAIAVDDTDTGLDTRGSERVFEALRTVADAGQLVIAACTRADPPADTVVDLRDRPTAAARPPRRERTRNGGLR